ncbi:hypothetical protein PUN28_010396 [Cardiocondyla obscurior]|uniref:Uncharacterized protein n=1 Tax=Cardiocondyla obscurior TaxID=286306 RepID=A0AAW2FR13_9HYME
MLKERQDNYDIKMKRNLKIAKRKEKKFFNYFKLLKIINNF